MISQITGLIISLSIGSLGFFAVREALNKSGNESLAYPLLGGLLLALTLGIVMGLCGPRWTWFRRFDSFTERYGVYVGLGLVAVALLVRYLG